MEVQMIKVRNIVKYFGTGDVRFKAIKNVNFSINNGDFVIMMGPSGSGKTTLLNILGGLERAEEGCVMYGDVDINHLSKSQRIKFRRENIGYVFQDYLLLSNLTALENVAIGANSKQETSDIPRLLEKVGLTDHQHKLPSELSGGQQQRVSILRALIKKPKVLICDEPTGALDHNSSIQVLQLIQKFHQEMNMTIIMVTHDIRIPDIGNKVMYLKDGNISDIVEQKPKKVNEIDWDLK